MKAWLGLLWMALAAQPEPDAAAQLLQLKRVYVDRFGGGEAAAQIRDMLIAALQRERLFIITENPERADAALRGSADDQVYTDVFQSGEAIGARGNVSGGRGGSSKLKNYAALGAGVSDSESTRIQERKHEASASVRIVAKDGDVIWSATEESQGAKFRSASADVADRIARRLAAEMGKSRAGPAAAPR
jgi:hypothetical protein